MGKEQEWRDRAIELYRIAQAELLQHLSGPQEDELAFLKEELQEALLDLKQAVIEEREEDASTYGVEVLQNLIELRERFGG